MEHYYSAREARQHLGLQVGAFYYLIDSGKLKKLTPPGKKHGFYSKQQIERLANERCRSLTGEREPGPTFSKARVDDLQEAYEFATLLLKGSAGYGLPTNTAWLRANPATNFIVRDQGRLVACLQVLPVKPETIKRWLKGEIRAWEISAEEVLPYTPGSAVECIITGMATTPDVERGKRRQYGARLLRGFLHVLRELAGQGITISRFYALGTTPEGSALLRQARFEESECLGKRVVFELNPLTSETRLLKAYRAALNEQ